MMRFLLLLLFALGITGCHSGPKTELTPTPSVEESLLSKADKMLAAQDFEGAAVAYREVLDQLEETKAPETEQQQVREKCTKALCEAGGFVASRKLWMDMAEKNPDSGKEAGRMKARAERMILQQGQELRQQAEDDLKQGRRSKALATAQASQVLFEMVKASENEMKPLNDLLLQLQESKEPNESPTP